MPPYSTIFTRLRLAILLSILVGPGRLVQGQTSSLRHSRTIGELQGAFALGAVGALAAKNNLLAIADNSDCRVMIFDLGKWAFVSKWGGCGGGPGEFKTITAMAWKGDSLFIADRRGNVIHILGPDGKQVRQLRPALGSIATGIFHIGIADDTTLILNLEILTPALTRGMDPKEANSFVALIDSRTGAIKHRMFEDADPRSLKNESPMLRSQPLCSGRESRRGIVATLSPWSFQGMIAPIMSTGRPPVQFSTPVEGFEPKKEGGKWLRVGFPSITCGDDAILLKWTKLSREKYGGVGGYLEVRDYSGKLMLSKHLETADSALFGVAGAATGNRFFVYSNRGYDYPVVVEFILEKGNSEATKGRTTR